MLSWPQKTPAEILDYGVDWSAWLAAGDTIQSIDVTVAKGSVTLAPSPAPAPANNTTAVTLWLAGGLKGETSVISCQVTTVAGRTAEALVSLFVE